MKIFKTPSSPRTRPELIELGVFFLLVVFVGWLSTQRQYIYFRDYSITFEGAYRLYLGQLPFKDFYMPLGPGGFVFPALIFKFTEPSWANFVFSQTLLNLFSLGLVFLILRKISQQPLVRALALVFFAAFYTLEQTHPWYNSTAALLMLAAVFFALRASFLSECLAGLFCGLTLMTKQDFGLLAFVLSACIITKNKLMPMVSTTRSTNLVLALLQLLALTLAPLFLLALATDFQQFLYWFNHGQSPHLRRVVTANDLFNNSYGHLGLFCLMAAIYWRNFNLFLIAALITAASISRTTSGLPFTHYYFVFVIPVLFCELYCSIKNKKIKYFWLILVFVASYKILAPAAHNTWHIFRALFQHRAEHFYFNPDKITKPVAPFSPELNVFQGPVVAPPATISALEEIQNLARRIQSRPEFQNQPGKTLQVFNLSELTPIYAQLGLAPPIHWPLWFHSKVSLFAPQIQDIKTLLSGEAYDLIVFQAAHEAWAPTYSAFAAVINNNPRYALWMDVSTSPAMAADACMADKENCEGHIFVYVKKEYLLSR